MTKGISRHLVGELRESAAPSPLFQEQYPAAVARVRDGKVVNNDHAAIIRPGISLSSFKLLEKRRG